LVFINEFGLICSQPVPCHFKERLDDFADKWLPVVVGGRRFELFLVKREDGTCIKGPFWTSLARSHNLAFNDSVTFTLNNQNGEEGANDQDGETEEEEEDFEHVFSVVARDPTGSVKEFQYNLGMFSSWHIFLLSSLSTL
jgi:hypothetical protein